MKQYNILDQVIDEDLIQNSGRAEETPAGRPPAPAGGARSRGEKKGKGKKRTLALLLLLLFVIALPITLHQFGVIKFPWDKAAAPPAPIIAGDLFPGVGDAQSGTLSGMTKEQIMEQMQLAADADYFSFKINTRMVFENGRAEGNMGIENPNYNVYPMVVRIYLGADGAGEMIYDSGGILPNQHIDKAKLTTVLPEGTYTALAYLFAYDPETQVNIFQSSAALDIIVNG